MIARILITALALLACAVAFGPFLGENLGTSWTVDLSALSPGARATLEKLFPRGGVYHWVTDERCVGN